MYEDGMLVVSVKVKGQAREILSASIDYQARILRNGIEDKFESDLFKNGDDLFLSFTPCQVSLLSISSMPTTKLSVCYLTAIRPQASTPLRQTATIFSSMRSLPPRKNVHWWMNTS